MKKTLFPLLLVLILIPGMNAQSVQDKPVKHFFACTDYTQGIVCIISDEGKMVWQYPATELQ